MRVSNRTAIETTLHLQIAHYSKIIPEIVEWMLFSHIFTMFLRARCSYSIEVTVISQTPDGSKKSAQEINVSRKNVIPCTPALYNTRKQNLLRIICNICSQQVDGTTKELVMAFCDLRLFPRLAKALKDVYKRHVEELMSKLAKLGALVLSSFT
jgi:hypothetical protein